VIRTIGVAKVYLLHIDLANVQCYHSNEQADEDGEYYVEELVYLEDDYHPYKDQSMDS
jgi:hypothetical protein